MEPNLKSLPFIKAYVHNLFSSLTLPVAQWLIPELFNMQCFLCLICSVNSEDDLEVSRSGTAGGITTASASLVDYINAGPDLQADSGSDIQ